MITRVVRLYIKYNNLYLCVYNIKTVCKLYFISVYKQSIDIIKAYVSVVTIDSTIIDESSLAYMFLFIDIKLST